MTPDQEIAKLKAEIASQRKRLDYVVIQLDREAKFLPEWKPENRRFYRAFTAVTEVRDALRGME